MGGLILDDQVDANTPTTTPEYRPARVKMTNLRLPADLVDRLKKRAQEEDRTVVQVAGRAISWYLLKPAEETP